MAHIVIFGSLAESLINFRGDLIEELVRRGHEVTGLAPPGPAWVDAELAKRGAHRRCIQFERTGLDPLADLRLLFELARCLRDLRPDVVLSYTIKPVVYGSIAARLVGVTKTAAMITGLGFAFIPGQSARRRLTSRVARMLYRVAMLCTDIVLFQNPDDEVEFRRYRLLSGRQRVMRTNGSGVNVRHFDYHPLPRGAMRFLMIARLLVDKGVREYLQAARRVRQTHPEAQFDLVGPYDANPSAIQPAEIEAAQAEGTILYHGAQADVRPFIRACHVYVLPSYREGTPRSVLEALAMGRPVITTDAPGCRETVLPGQNGFLVPARAIEPLAAAMLRFIEMSSPELDRMARAARELATSKFDVTLVNATIIGALGT